MTNMDAAVVCTSAVAAAPAACAVPTLPAAAGIVEGPSDVAAPTSPEKGWFELAEYNENAVMMFHLSKSKPR